MIFWALCLFPECMFPKCMFPDALISQIQPSRITFSDHLYQVPLFWDRDTSFGSGVHVVFPNLDLPNIVGIVVNWEINICFELKIGCPKIFLTIFRTNFKLIIQVNFLNIFKTGIVAISFKSPSPEGFYLRNYLTLSGWVWAIEVWAIEVWALNLECQMPKDKR